MPVLFAAAAVGANVEPGSPYLQSQAGIVATFKRLTAGQPAELVYVLDKPYSADFYSGGQAKLVSGPNDIAATLQGSRRYFVIASDLYAKMPEALRQRLEVVETRNDSVLLRGKTL